MILFLQVFCSIIAYLLIYLSFGSLLFCRRGKNWSLGLTIVVGFFLYYSCFFFCAVPIMIRFRPLSMLTKIWMPIVLAVVLLSGFLNGKAWFEKAKEELGKIKQNRLLVCVLLAIVVLQIVLVTKSYNFTLDAAYYVASVSTNVETNMINVYDPFTGAWLDHYEMRYFFATYSVMDAVWCQFTGIPALIQTKTIMAAIVIMLTNIIYYLISGVLFQNKKSRALMVFLVFVLNMMFVTMYTSSQFLLTRTYEGKAIIGNLSVFAVLLLFMKLMTEKNVNCGWISLFIVCFGSMTISSSANMLLPVELTVLFLPMMFMKKDFRIFPKYAACVLPGLLMAVMFVAYVKGYFVLYTYPR